MIDLMTADPIHVGPARLFPVSPTKAIWSAPIRTLPPEVPQGLVEICYHPNVNVSYWWTENTPWTKEAPNTRVWQRNGYENLEELRAGVEAEPYFQGFEPGTPINRGYLRIPFSRMAPGRLEVGQAPKFFQLGPYRLEQEPRLENRLFLRKRYQDIEWHFILIYEPSGGCYFEMLHTQGQTTRRDIIVRDYVQNPEELQGRMEKVKHPSVRDILQKMGLVSSSGEAN